MGGGVTWRLIWAKMGDWTLAEAPPYFLQENLMSLRGLHEFDDKKNLQVKFILQEPHSLTGRDEKEVTVSAAPGQNLLNIAIEAGIEIEHSCGGVCACSTCHVWVNKGAEVL